MICVMVDGGSIGLCGGNLLLDGGWSFIFIVCNIKKFFLLVWYFFCICRCYNVLLCIRWEKIVWWMWWIGLILVW